MCVGAENESEAVGDAQQVGDFLFIPQRTKMLSGFASVHTRKKKPPTSDVLCFAAGILSDTCASTPAPW